MSRRTREARPTESGQDPTTTREKGWDNRITPTEKLVRPGYDAVGDPYCPITKTSKFKKHLLNVLHREEEDRAARVKEVGEEGLGWMLQSSMKPGELSRREIRELEDRVSKTLSTASGGITMAFEREDTDPGTEAQGRVREVDVLKNVILREEYMRRLTVLLTEMRRKPPEGLSPLLDLLRICSVETVEAIALWRDAMGPRGRSVPFTWNGINYLLTMASDLDYLEQHKGFRAFLGFTAYRNPFLVPLPLEQSSLPQAGNQKGEDGGAGGLDLAHFQSRFYNNIGNDLELPIHLKRRAEGGGARAHVSAIGDLDMIRVRQAERVILQEEEANFRFVRNAEGRAVPASLANTETLRQVLQGDQGRDVRLPSTAHPYAAPLADVSGVGRTSTSNPTLEGHGSGLRDKAQRGGANPNRRRRGGGEGRVEAEMAKAAKGRINAKKDGGALAKLSTRGSSGRRHGRLAPSPGASLDQTTVTLRSELQTFHDSLQELRQRLAAAQSELSTLEGAACAGGLGPSPTHAQGKGKRPSTAPLGGEGEGPRSPSVGGGERQQGGRGAGGGVSPQRRSLSARAAPVDPEVLEEKRGAVKQLAEQLRVGEAEEARRSSRLSKREETMDKLKDAQRNKVAKDNALNVERKRRLLDPSALDFPEDADQGPALEDIAATHIQRIVRGRLSRVATACLRSSMFQVATLLQRFVRGFNVRQQYRRTVETNRKVSKVQALQRGRSGRRRAGQAVQERRRHQASITVSRMIVGYYGRRRFERRRQYNLAGRDCALLVGPSQLFHSDVNELARRVDRALQNPLLHAIPPVVLGLLRVVILLLGGGLVTYISATGAPMPKPLNYARDIEWLDALRVLRRGSKFLRQLRVLSSGPSAKRPRLLHVPQRALELYEAYKADPQWNASLVRGMGEGGGCAGQLLLWVEAIVTVFKLQNSFLHEIGGVEPEWLVRHRDYCRSKRELGLLILQKERYCNFLKASIDRDAESERYLPPRLRALEAEQLTLQSLIDKRAQLEAEEQEQKDRETLAEIDEINKIREEIVAYQRGMAEKREEYIIAEDKARRGNKVQEGRLSVLLQDLAKLELDLREANVALKIRSVLHQRAHRLRKDQVPYDGNVTARCGNVGEALGAVAMFGSDVDVLKQSIDKLRARHTNKDTAKEVEGLIRRDSEELDMVTYRLDAARLKAHEAQEALNKAVGEFEEGLLRRWAVEKMRESAGLLEDEGWGAPSRDEALEDEREDLRLAREEAEMLQQWVPRDVLTSKKFPDARPVLLCVSRDVPQWAKEHIYTNLTAELAGVFIRVRVSESMGLDLARLQTILASGCSVVADVDAGLTLSMRRQFLNALTIAKRALSPSPQVVLLLGNVDNPGMDQLTGQRGHLGLCDDDWLAMANAPIKKRLHAAAECLHVLVSGEYRVLIEGLAKRDKPPCNQYIVVMEAMAILFTPQGTFRSPSRNHAAASWFTVKRCTAPYADFCQRLRGVDKTHIPPDNLLILEEYLAHPNWPGAADIIKDADPVLWYFTTWAQSIIELASIYRDKEGPAPLPDRRNPEGLFSGVIKVCSAESELREEDEAGAGRGWRAAYALLMSYVLEDFRCLREGRKLNDHLYTVSVYQLGARLFFNAYCPLTSTYRHASLLLSEVSMLLSPSSFQTQHDVHWNEPPKTHHDVCTRLVSLLCVQHVSKAFGDIKRLMCRRRLQRLRRHACKISGHQAVLSVFEESKGELRCVVYLPALSVTVDMLVNANSLSTCAQNLDRELEAGVESEDVVTRMIPIADRLEVSPSWTAVANMGYMPPSLRVWSFHTAMHRDNSQGFKLHLRRHAGAGHRLFRKVTQLSGRGVYAISAMECGHRSTLRVRVYNPMTGHEQEVRLNNVERACLFGSAIGAEWRTWRPQLLNRLKLRPGLRRESGEEDIVAERDTVVLDRKVSLKLFKSKPEEGYSPVLFRLAVYIDKRGAALLVDVRVNNKPDRYTMILSWDILLAANGIRLDKQSLPSEDLEAMQDYVSSLAAGQRLALFHSIALGMRYSEPRDEVEMGPAFQHAILRNWKVGGDDFEVNASMPYKDTAVGALAASAPLPPPPPTSSVFSKRQRQRRAEPPLCELSELQTFVASARFQASMTTYEHELGHETPVSYRPPPPGTQVVLSTTTKRRMDTTQPAKEGTAREPLHGASEGGEEKAKDPPVSRRSSSLGEDGPAPGERVVFNQGVKVMHELHKVRTWYATVNLRVFESYTAAPVAGEEEGGEREGEGKEEEKRIEAVRRSSVSVAQRLAVPDKPPDPRRRVLRLVVYRVTSSAYSHVTIAGFDILREVVGSARQDLIAPGRQEEMFHHIAHSRLVLMEGLWNAEVDRYEPTHDDSFTLVLRRDRLYAMDKATPLHVGGGKDEAANAKKLINDRVSRGTKILRCAKNIQGVFMHVTVFEVMSAEGEAGTTQTQEGGPPKDAMQLMQEEEERRKRKPFKVPKLRFVAFNPATGNKSVLLPCREAILENVGGEFAPILDPSRRSELARALLSYAILKRRDRNDVTSPMDVVLPYSGGDHDVRLLKSVRPGEDLEEMLLAMPGRLVQMGIHVEDLHVQVTVFKVEEPQEDPSGGGSGEAKAEMGGAGVSVGSGALRVNFCCAKIEANQDVYVDVEQQVDLLGRPVSEFVGRAKELALRKLVDKIGVSIAEDQEPRMQRRASLEEGEAGTQNNGSRSGSSGTRSRRTRLCIDVMACKNKPWLRAYQRCNPAEMVLRNRPRGQPLVFIPSTLKGDLLWRRGVKISGTQCLLTVSSKNKGLAAAQGLIFEAYDPLTCTSATLHVGRSELLKEVDFKEELLQRDVVTDTIEALMYRLKLVRDVTNAITLAMDIKINPDLFRFAM